MLIAALATLLASDSIYQAMRKPSELFIPVSGVLYKTPCQTWEAYGFRAKTESGGSDSFVWTGNRKLVCAPRISIATGPALRHHDARAYIARVNALQAVFEGLAQPRTYY